MGENALFLQQFAEFHCGVTLIGETHKIGGFFAVFVGIIKKCDNQCFAVFRCACSNLYFIVISQI